MSIAPADLLVYAGGACLEPYGRLWRVTRPADRAGEEGAPTVTRATAGTYIDRDGRLQTAAAGAPRVWWLDGTVDPHLLLEPARTQLVTNPENFGAWTVIGTPVVTGGQADPYGGTAAYLLTDDDGAVQEGIYENVAFTGDGIKAGVWHIRVGTSPAASGGSLKLRDTTAGADRLRLVATVVGGIPSVDAQVGTVLDFVDHDDGWYAVWFATAAVTAANTNRFEQYGAETTSEQGDLYVFGVNAWDAVYATTYQGPTLATRNADQVDLPLYLPQAIDWSLYLRLQVHHGGVTDVGAEIDFLELSDEAGAFSGDNRIRVYRDNNSKSYKAEWLTAASGTVTATDTLTASVQEVILRQQASGHNLQLEVDGVAGSYGSAPTGHGTAQGAHRTLRLHGGGWRCAALMVARDSRTRAEFQEWLP